MSSAPMSFFHADGMVPAWTQASSYAGKGGHIATLPEIMEARLASDENSPVWHTYYTTNTAEYLGRGADGKMLIIVAHGVGPMSTLEGIKKAYSYQYKSKDRDQRGGRISHKEFLALEAGKYGPVFKADYEQYVSRFEYPFIEATRHYQFPNDQLLIARMGGKDLRDEYEERALRIYRNFLMKRQFPGFEPSWLADRKFLSMNLWEIATLNRSREFKNPYLIQNTDDHNLPYFAYPMIHPESDLAFAHLLSIGAHQTVQFCEEKLPSVLTDIACHAWYDGTRFLAIPKGASLNKVLDGPDPRKLIRENWPILMVPATKRSVSSLFNLMKMDEQWFTQYRGQNDVMDSAEPQFVVTDIEPVGGVGQFKTPVLGYYGFFKYEMSQVKKFAPPQANAYCFVGEPTNVHADGDIKEQVCNIQFYKVSVETTQQVMRAEDLSRDFPLMLKLMGI